MIMTPEPTHFGIDTVTTMDQFIDIILWGTILTPRNAFIVVPVWLLHHAVVSAFPKGKVRSGLNRARELIYIVSCNALVWSPGLRPEIESWGFRLGLGIALGGLTMLVPWGLGMLGERFGINALKDPRKK